MCINTNEDTHSEMVPVWQNPIHRTVWTAHLSLLMTVHSFSTQNNTEQFWQSPLLPSFKHHSSAVVYQRTMHGPHNTSRLNCTQFVQHRNMWIHSHCSTVTWQCNLNIYTTDVCSWIGFLCQYHGQGWTGLTKCISELVSCFSYCI